ncbi:response regulator [Candidatus Omnitrophota bacterium]
MTEVENKKEKGDKLLDILIVEDSDADVKIALRAFERAKLKHRMHVASDGQEALDFIRHEGKYKDKKKMPVPDLILLDIKLPKVDGFGVLKELKADLQYCHIPIVMLTSSRDEEDILKSYKSGASSFIPKPVKYEDFVKVVEIINTYWNTISKLPNTNLWK